MGGSGVWLEVSGDGDRAALHSAIWQAARTFVGRHTTPAESGLADQYVDGAIEWGERQGGWGVDGDVLEWWFKDFAGNCDTSSAAWTHWLNLALAADWARYLRLAEEHGLAIVSAPPVLAELLNPSEFDLGLVELRGDLWSAEEDGLSGDGEFLSVDELSSDERARHGEALERCLCGPCTTLRQTETRKNSAVVD